VRLSDLLHEEAEVMALVGLESDAV
jgi:hypothetical protein